MGPFRFRRPGSDALIASIVSILLGLVLATLAAYKYWAVDNLPLLTASFAAVFFAHGTMLWFSLRAAWIIDVVLNAGIVLVSVFLLLSIGNLLGVFGLYAAYRLYQLLTNKDDTYRQPEVDTDDAPHSLVMLLREPVHLEAEILANLATRAWGLELESLPDLGDEAERLDDMDADGQKVEDKSPYIVGVPPMFLAWLPDKVFTIHCWDEPYVEDPQELAEQLSELRARRAVAEHQAWVSVDVIDPGENDDELTDAYRYIARLLAELADENCLAVLDPRAGSVFVYDPEMERKLRSDDPRGELQRMYYAPILSVQDDDPGMVAAVEEARSRWGEFVAAFENRNPDDDEPFMVKAPFRQGDDVEYMWVKVTAVEHEVIYGLLDNDPHALTRLRCGDTVRVPLHDLADWICVIEGKPAGGFTLKVLSARQGGA